MDDHHQFHTRELSGDCVCDVSLACDFVILAAAGGKIATRARVQLPTPGDLDPEKRPHSLSGKPAISRHNYRQLLRHRSLHITARSN